MKAHELWKKTFGDNPPAGHENLQGPWTPGWQHPPSKDGYEGVAQWVDPKFFFSKNIGWDNIGIIGVLADYALNFIAGDILEIGCGVSSIYLTALSKKYNRKIYYCDIQGGKIINPLSVPGHMNEENGVFYLCPSDDMFAKRELTPLSFTFIDGDHTYAQAKKDFWNAVELTVPNGHILMHDTYPPSEDYCDFQCCGDVYKFRQEIEKDPRFDVFTFTGYGSYVASTLIRKKPINRPYYQE
jgi:hypothetical protein